MIYILHLYPNLMNLYGDYANITVLKKHLEDQEQIVRVEKKDIGSNIDFSKYDFIYMGSGTESSRDIALTDLLRYKDDLKQCIENGKTILFTGNAMELLGNTIGNKQGLGIVNFDVETTTSRYTGDVIMESKQLGEIVGFINKSTFIKGGEDSKLFDYFFMDNNLKDNNYEGYRINNTYGTHIIGPVLVKNPKFMKTIIESILPEDFEYKEIEYTFEEDNYLTTLAALKERMQ